MHIITVSTDELNSGPRNSHRQPGMLADSCKAFGHHLTVLGVNQGGTLDRPAIQKQKLVWLRDYLRANRQDELILFTDGWDSFIAAESHRIEYTFGQCRCKVLFSAETNLFPAHVATYLPAYPAAMTPWRYLNSGGFMGQADILFDMLCCDAFSESGLSMFERDQDAWHHFFLQHPGRITLDYHCQIFQTLFMGVPLEYYGYGFQNRITGTYPCVFHGNGGLAAEAYTLWQQVKKELDCD